MNNTISFNSSVSAWNRAHLRVDFASLTRQGRHVCGYPSPDQALVEPRQLFAILRNFFRSNGEVESISTVQLDIHEAWRNYPSTQVDDSIWPQSVFIEYLLSIENAARLFRYPEVLIHKLFAPDQPAVGEFDDSGREGTWSPTGYG